MPIALTNVYQTTIQFQPHHHLDGFSSKFPLQSIPHLRGLSPTINSSAPPLLYLPSATQRKQGHKRLPTLIFDKTPEREPTKVRHKFYQNLNHYFLAHENFIPLTLIKCNSFTLISLGLCSTMPFLQWPLALPSWHSFALCSLQSILIILQPPHPTLVTIPPSFQLRMTRALLFGCQQPPPAPNIAVFYCT